MKFKKLNQLSKIEMGSLLGGTQPGDTEKRISGCTAKYSSDTYLVYWTYSCVNDDPKTTTWGWRYVDNSQKADSSDSCSINQSPTSLPKAQQGGIVN